MISNIRTTFGTTDPATGLMYDDIVQKTIIRMPITSDDISWGNTKVVHEGITYYLSIDKRLRDAVATLYIVEAIISLQQRTDINIAVARLPISEWARAKQAIQNKRRLAK